MKNNFKILITVLFLMFNSFSAYSQVVDLGDEDDIVKTPPPAENPFASSFSTDSPFGNDVAGGFESSSNLESAMTDNIIDSATLVLRDTFIKYDVVVDPKLDIKNFDYKGLWKIAYKEVKKELFSMDVSS